MVEVPFSIVAGGTLILGIILIVMGIFKEKPTVTIVGLLLCCTALTLAICDNNLPYMSRNRYIRTVQETSKSTIEPWYHDDGHITTVEHDGRLINHPSKIVEFHPTTDEPHITTTMSKQVYGVRLGGITLTAKNSYITTEVDIYLPQNIVPPQP